MQNIVQIMEQTLLLLAIMVVGSLMELPVVFPYFQRYVQPCRTPKQMYFLMEGYVQAKISLGQLRLVLKEYSLVAQLFMVYQQMENVEPFVP